MAASFVEGQEDGGHRGSATVLARDVRRGTSSDVGHAAEVPCAGCCRCALGRAGHPGPLGGNAAHAGLEEEEGQQVRHCCTQKGGPDVSDDGHNEAPGVDGA